MSFNIQRFKSTVESQGGLLTNNKFLVTFAAPKKLQSQLGKHERNMQFFCKAAPLPGIGIMTSEGLRYGYGTADRRPHGVVFNDLMLQFNVDSKNMVRKWFRSWVGLIVNPSAQNGIKTKNSVTKAYAYEFGYKEDYATDITITAFSPEGKACISIVIQDAFPNYIGETMMDWEDKNSNMLLPVSITYRDWYEKGIMEPDLTRAVSITVEQDAPTTFSGKAESSTVTGQVTIDPKAGERG